MAGINQLTEAQEERFALLVEEAGEILQIIGKIQRHGLLSSHSDYYNVSNSELLCKEIGHFQARLDLLVSAEDLDPARIEHHRMLKHVKKPNFLHYQND